MVRMMVSPPDAVAEGIIEATKEVKVKTPIIAIMRGRELYQKRAQELLKGSEVNLYSDIGEGTREAIRIAR